MVRRRGGGGLTGPANGERAVIGFPVDLERHRSALAVGPLPPVDSAPRRIGAPVPFEGLDLVKATRAAAHSVQSFRLFEGLCVIYLDTLQARRDLHALATTQGGYFTAKQARAAGYGYPHLAYHVGKGTFERD